MSFLILLDYFVRTLSQIVRAVQGLLCFRPCAMVVPDFGMICEIMLMSEGFIDARLLARKFITLYTLCRELLSKQVSCLLAILFSVKYFF